MTSIFASVIARIVTAGGRNDGAIAIFPPIVSGMIVVTVYPNEWKLGSTVKNVSAPVTEGIIARVASQFERKFPCVNGTAFGSPVVPDVAKITARSSGSGD